MKPSTVSQQIRNQSGASFQKEIAQAAEFYRTHEWEWSAATPHGPAYRTFWPESEHAGLPTMMLAQGHPRHIGRPGKMTPVEANAVDFVGWSRVPPIGIAFDCKVVTGKVSFALDLTHPRKKPDAKQVKWLRDFQDAGGLAGYLLCERSERVCWFLTGTDLATLADGARVTFASRERGTGMIETARLTLMQSGRSQLIGAQAVYEGPVKAVYGALPWDIAALFRVHLGISSRSGEQGLVLAPGDRFLSSRRT